MIRRVLYESVGSLRAYLRRLNPPGLDSRPLRINYGCGLLAQPGYVGVDVRWTPAVEVIGDLSWCRRAYAGKADEVYCSHVLEHYRYPGKEWRSSPETVLGALSDIMGMLKPGGIVRIAVPDFAAIARLYVENAHPYFPVLSGRVNGEQDYAQNRHLCMFDRSFLEKCLSSAGFVDFEVWDPESMGFVKDSSFDCVAGVVTSLNVMARKPLK